MMNLMMQLKRVVFSFLFLSVLQTPFQSLGQLSSSDSNFFNNTLFIENLYIDYLNFPGNWYQNKEVESISELYQQIDSMYPFHNNQLWHAYQNIGFNSNLYYDTILNRTIDTFNVQYQDDLFLCKNPFVRLDYIVDSTQRSLEIFLDSAKDMTLVGKKAFVLLTGTGQNEMSLMIGNPNNYHNSNCYIKNYLTNFGDVYVTTTPNEDMRAIRFMGKKLARYWPLFPNFLLNYLNGQQHAMGINKLIEVIALVKYLKNYYTEVNVLGLSTGGTEALWVSMLSNPTATVVSSGYSILCDTDSASLAVNAQFYGNCLDYFTKDTLKKYFQQSPTRYLFTQALNDSPICQAEINGQHTPSFFTGLNHVEFNYTYYNHSFPPCDIIDSFLHLSPTIPVNTDEVSLPRLHYSNPIQNELFIQVPPSEKDWQYALINLQGIIVKSGKLDADQNHVLVADLSDGVYVLQLKHRSGQFENHKVLIRR
jgi:hypothetical protein